MSYNYEAVSSDSGGVGVVISEEMHLLYHCHLHGDNQKSHLNNLQTPNSNQKLKQEQFNHLCRRLIFSQDIPHGRRFPLAFASYKTIPTYVLYHFMDA